jgi:hypothetical protein
MRILSGHKRRDHVSKLQLLEETGMTSINRMAAATLLGEMWRVLGGDLEEWRMITATSSTSTKTTRSRTEEKLKLGAPSTCFAYSSSVAFATKLYLLPCRWPGHLG